MRVFLDIDDTLNSFTMFNLKENFDCRCVDNHFDYNAFLDVCPGEYNIVKACKLLGGGSWTLEGFWESFTECCWSQCPKSIQFDFILNTAQKLTDRRNIFLATDLTKNPCCASGKMKWIYRVCPEWLRRNWFMTPRKAQIAAGPEDVLFDDRDATIDMWRNRGGIGILVPRPWNRDWPLWNQVEITLLANVKRELGRIL